MNQNVLCPNCAQQVGAHPKVSFFGFPKFFCPACDREATLPLGTGRLIVYSLVALLAVGYCIKILVDGQIPMIGILPALVIAALIMDISIRSRLRSARAHHRSATP